MAEFTWPGGQKAQIDESLVLRIRGTVPSDGTSGKSLVDWAEHEFFMETPEVVAAVVGQKLKTLTSLKLPSGEPVWFNGKKAIGPQYVVPVERGDGVVSAFDLGNRRQYVSSTPQEVADAIKAQGGTVLPIREDREFGLFLVDKKSVIPPWDPFHNVKF